jgi:hypothetical protein
MLIDPTDPLGRTFVQVHAADLEWDAMKYRQTRMGRLQDRLGPLLGLGFLFVTFYVVTHV